MGPSWRRMWIFLGVFAHVFPGRRSSLNASPLEIKVSWLQFEQNLCDLNPFPLSEALRRVGAHRIPGLYRRRKKKQQNPPQNRMKANMFLGRVCKSSTRGRWSTTAVLLKSPQHRFPSREEPKPQGQTPKWGELEAARGRGCGGRLRKDENQRVIAWLRLEGPSMALQETYGNWMGPPPVPAKRLVRQAGKFGVKRTVLGVFFWGDGGWLGNRRGTSCGGHCCWMEQGKTCRSAGGCSSCLRRPKISRFCPVSPPDSVLDLREASAASSPAAVTLVLGILHPEHCFCSRFWQEFTLLLGK